MITQFADVEGAVRDWLRAVPEIVALVEDRVFFGVPVGAVFPLLVVQQAGGGRGRGEAPLSDPLIQIDSWGPERNKRLTAQVKNAVEGALDALGCNTQMNPTTQAMGAYGVTSIWLPDPQSNQARYVTTASVSAKYKAA